MELKVEKLGVSFEQVVFQNLNFDFNAGDWVTIVGKSGTGKSVFLKSLARLMDVTSGQIIFNGQDIQDLAIGTYRQQVSYAVQSASLFGKTVRDNLDFPFIVRDQAIDVQKQQAGLRQMDLPVAYLDHPITELSGGQRQRVGVLRNLLFPPEVLLLDEISTGLDAETKQLIWQVIQTMHQTEGNIVLSVTHDADEMASARDLIEFGTEIKRVKK